RSPRVRPPTSLSRSTSAPWRTLRSSATRVARDLAASVPADGRKRSISAAATLLVAIGRSFHLELWAPEQPYFGIDVRMALVAALVLRLLRAHRRRIQRRPEEAPLRAPDFEATFAIRVEVDLADGHVRGLGQFAGYGAAHLGQARGR